MAVTLGTIDLELILRPKGADRETVLGVVSIPLNYGPQEPCPETGLQECPWHPDGGNHPGATT